MSRLNWSSPVFIVACTNSGTKLLQQTLATHPDLNNFPIEPHYFGFGPNLDGRINRLFALWPCFKSSHIDAGTAKSSSFTPEAGPLDKASFKTTLELYLSHPDNQNHIKSLDNRILIKEPKFSLRIPWLLKMFPDAKIISLVRNPWSVSEGIRRRCHSIGDVPLRLDIPTCAAQWLAVNTILRMHSQRTHCVHYENLVINPEGTLGAILEHLNLPHSKPTLDFLRNSAKQSLLYESIGRLTKFEFDYISTACRDMINYHGYKSIKGVANETKN